MPLLHKVNTPDDVKKLNISELKTLAAETRDFLVENVMHTGGHLASNLGVVEITLAMLKTFNFPKDKIVFDVGHQCYVYKMLTGRKDKFSTLRHLGGISGFPRTSESEYDFFDVGHAGTSLSSAIGLARARDLRGTDEHIIALVGDGALTSGMSFEALNDVGLRKTRLIIILNDNEMSIHKNVGGLSSHLTKLRFTPRYIHTKTRVQSVLEKFGKAGTTIEAVIRKTKDKLKYAAIAAPLFEQLGLTYMGIINGNDTEELIRAFESAKKMDGPVVIHTFTKKGMGYVDAENDPSKYHGVSSHTSRISPKDISYDYVFSSLVTSHAEKNKKIVAITAAMTSGCGLLDFSNKFPERFFDVGIAEEHAVTMAAGLAKGGYVPVVCLYSTFLQRTYDQIIHDVCLQNLKVVLAVGHSGLTGEDGETHQGLMDIAMLSQMPNMTVLAPSSYEEFKEMLRYAIDDSIGPVAIRYPKDSVSFRKAENINPLKAEKLTDGDDVMILSCGRMIDTALKAAQLLNDRGISSKVINIRSVKPLDTETISEEIKNVKLIVTIEDGIIPGGMGQYAVSHILKGLPTLNLGFDTCFIPHGKQSELFEIYGLDAKSVCEKIQTFYKGMIK